jgi:hypothetical protein
MNKQKGISTTLSILLVALLFTVVGGGIVYKYYLAPEGEISGGEPKEPQDENDGEFFQINQPKQNQKIISPIRIEGEANLFEHKTLDEWIIIEISDENGHKLGSNNIKTEGGRIEGFFLQEVSYKQPTSEKGLIKIFEYIPEEEFVPTEGALESYIPKTLLEIPVVFSEKLLVIPDNWKVYDNSNSNFTFRYPLNWEITEDYLYKTPAGVEAKERTVLLGEIGEKAVVQINMRQCSCPSREVSKSSHTEYVAICSTDPEILDIYKRIVGSFRIID